MLKPREGMMNYSKEEELCWNYMFVAACLPEEEYEVLKKKFEEQGGVTVCPWWKFIAENTNVSISLK